MSTFLTHEFFDSYSFADLISPPRMSQIEIKLGNYDVWGSLIDQLGPPDCLLLHFESVSETSALLIKNSLFILQRGENKLFFRFFFVSTSGEKLISGLNIVASCKKKFVKWLEKVKMSVIRHIYVSHGRPESFKKENSFFFENLHASASLRRFGLPFRHLRWP